MSFDTPTFQALMNNYSKLTSKELFEICSHASQQNKQAACLVLLSKTDSEGICYQYHLVDQHDNLLEGTEDEFKKLFIKAMYKAIQAPASTSVHKLAILSFLKHIENYTICIPKALSDAFLSDPLYFPLFALKAFIPQCHNYEKMLLLSMLQYKLRGENYNTRYRALRALAELASTLDSTQITDTLITDLQKALQDKKSKFCEEAHRAIIALTPKLHSSQITTIINNLKTQLETVEADTSFSMVLDTITILEAKLNPTHITSIFADLAEKVTPVNSQAYNAMKSLVSELTPAQVADICISLKEKLFDGDITVCHSVLKSTLFLAPKLSLDQMLSLHVKIYRLGERALNNDYIDIIKSFGSKSNLDDVIINLYELFSRGTDKAYYSLLNAFTLSASKINLTQFPTLVTDLKRTLTSDDMVASCLAIDILKQLVPKLNSKEINTLIIKLKPLLDSGEPALYRNVSKLMDTLKTKLNSDLLINSESIVQDQLSVLIQSLEEINRNISWPSFSVFFISNHANSEKKEAILTKIAKIIPHADSACLSPWLLQLIQKELTSNRLEVRELAWDLLILLAFRFPSQINELLASSSVNADDWSNSVLSFLLALSERQKIQADALEFSSADLQSKSNAMTFPTEASIIELNTLFSGCLKSKNKHDSVKKWDLTKEEREELQGWSNNFENTP